MNKQSVVTLQHMPTTLASSHRLVYNQKEHAKKSVIPMTEETEYPSDAECSSETPEIPPTLTIKKQKAKKGA